MMSDNSPPGSPNKLQQRLSECFERGNLLMTRDKNYDYAHTMFAECATQVPGNLVYVETLLRNLRLKTPLVNQKHKLFGQGANREIKQAVDRKEWMTVVRLGIESLKSDPWNVTVLRTLAQACENLHQNEAELAYLKQALDASPKNLDVNRHCARSLARMGQFDQAIACWHRIEILHPGDREAPKMISLLSDEKCKYPGGRPPIVTKAPLQPALSSTPQTSLATEPPELTLSHRQKLEQAIATDSKNIANYLELADLHLTSDHFQEAEAVLQKGISTCGEHNALKSRLQEVHAIRSQREMEIAAVRRREIERRNRPIYIPWLEILLFAAGVALVLQFFPAIATRVWNSLDFRQWSRVTWFTLNILGLLFCLAFRFVNSIYRSW